MFFVNFFLFLKLLQIFVHIQIALNESYQDQVSFLK